MILLPDEALIQNGYRRRSVRREHMYKILIVEDDLTIAKTIQSHLARWDYEVHCVTDFKNVQLLFTR